MVKPQAQQKKERKGYQNSPAGSSIAVPTRVLLVLLCLLCDAAVANDNSVSRSPPSPAELAADADIVAVVQIRDTDYMYRRNLPYRGSAYLKVLISYKGAALPEIIEVFEEGLHEFECYFPNPSVFEEGRRYLVFLEHDTENTNRFRGMRTGCAIDVLVRANNHYAIRMPIEGVAMSGDLDSLSEAMEFADSYAWETQDRLSSERRDKLIEDGYLEADSDRYRWTRGIDLSVFRQLLQPGLR